MQPNQIYFRMARDERLNAFNAEAKKKLFPEFMNEILHQAEMDVLKDTKCRVKEQDITTPAVTTESRAVNLPDDFMIIDNVRYKETTDDALFEGFAVEIVDESDMP